MGGRGARLVRLTDHYQLSDFTFSATAIRHGIDQSRPPPQIISNLHEVAYALEEIQRGMGYYVPRILSGYRCPALNALVGGSATSAHMDGLAVDFICPAFGSVLELCKFAANNVPDYDQIIYEYRSWCHLGLSATGAPRKMLMTKVRGEPYKIGLYG
jgi:zinc D-Ala-D-Ala carboxypeptidase